MSRRDHPKQFLPLVSEQSLFVDTLQRARQACNGAAPIVVCSEAHRFLVAEQLRELSMDRARIILEPVGRNTAPAIGLAALAALAEGDDPLLLILPSDHAVDDLQSFRASVQHAASHAAAGKLVTFGVVPTRAETGYGYIRGDGTLDALGARTVAEFVEKPDPAAAQRYVDSGAYFWNSGMFLFRASCYLAELQRFAPDMAEGCRTAFEAANQDMDFLRVGAEAFASCPSESVDYAVMERTQDAVVVPLNVGWSDVGTWSAIWGLGKVEGDGNLLRGEAYVVDVRNSLVHSSGRVVAAVGVDDLIIVETSDAVLVAHRDRVQDVRAAVDCLTAAGRQEAYSHRQVYRPWGNYDSVDSGQRFQVKRITVNPGACLSLQMHFHRAEHWVVVQGTARVTRGDDVVLLTENQSTYIPPGTRHRLENPGKIPLELIEVQSGSYLGEDDIVRYDDSYGRAGEGCG
jgi:mannose-1-phosphate guanylyltransferase/mannose-6-phosphate isomerase